MGEPEKRVGGLDVECSWLALPDIESGAWTGPVVHIVRHPVPCVKSLAELGLFGRHAEPHPYRDFVREQCPAVARLDRADAAAYWWDHWNRRCMNVADLSIRVEHLPLRLSVLVSALDLELLDRPEVEPDSIPITLNHSPRGYDPSKRREVSSETVFDAVDAFVPNGFGYSIIKEPMEAGKR